MTAIRIGLVLAASGLVALILWAAMSASISESFAAIAADPWGLVSIVDLYLGFIVLGVLLALVERPVIAALWFAGLLVLGNVVAALWMALRLPRLVARLRQAR